MKKLILLLFSLLLSACATVHTGNYATDINNVKTQGVPKDLLVSGGLVERMSSEYFGYMVFTFENTTSDWIEISGVKVSFDDPALENNIEMLSGFKLNRWFESIRIRNAVRRHNEFAVLTGVLGASMLTSSSSSRTSGDAAKSLAAISTVGVASKVIGASRDKANLPSSHLLSGNILVPPGLSAKRWILFNSKNHNEMNYFDKINLIFTDQDKQEKEYQINIRKSNNRLKMRQGNQKPEEFGFYWIK